MMRIAIAGGTGVVGRHVAQAAERRGHDVVALSRRTGQDLETGEGLEAALAGTDALVDVSSVATMAAKRSTEFFTTATDNMLRAEQAAGVTHHLALSIVGIDGIDAGYYAGKLAQERAVAASPIPWSLLRAAQFHEFAEQMVSRGSFGPVSMIPRVPMRPVAASEVGERLVEVVEAGPSGRVRDLTGPEDAQLIALVRRMLTFDGSRRRVAELPPLGRYLRGCASGALRGGDEADRGRITFDEWMRSPDHTRQA